MILGRGVFALAACLATSSAARAEAPPRSLSGGYSAYERSVIRRVESSLGARVDPTPEGKRIESVEWVGLDPIEPVDPVPSVLNVLHVRTQRWVIGGELLLREGDSYRKVLSDESARNLRAHRQLSLVIAVPLAGRSTSSVRLVVITKDVWSLIPDFDISMSNDELNSFTFTPTELNFLGTHQIVLGRLEIEPIYGRYAVGGGYRVPRLWRSRINLALDATVLFNDETGAVEGSRGRFNAVQPLTTQRSDWAWFSGVLWGHEVTRPDLRGEPAREWRSRTSEWLAAVTRSFGWQAKNDVSLGVRAASGSYLPLDPAADPAFVRSLRMPPSESKLSPLLEWHAYAGDFLRTFDLETLGLQEEFRLGHDVVARFAPTFVIAEQLPPEWLPDGHVERSFYF
ncbi:MAG TPA: hypothetical protein VGK73_00180, partial [Polyangiaceae bacterium]